MPFRQIARRDNEADVIGDIVQNSEFADCSLQFLAEEFGRRKSELERYIQSAIEGAWYLGEILVLIKSKADHGQWLPFLEAHNWNARTAQRYMQLRRRYPTIEAALQQRTLQAALEAGDSENDSEAHLAASPYYVVGGVVFVACGDHFDFVGGTPAQRHRATQIVLEALAATAA